MEEISTRLLHEYLRIYSPSYMTYVYESSYIILKMGWVDLILGVGGGVLIHEFLEYFFPSTISLMMQFNILEKLYFKKISNFFYLIYSEKYKAK